MSAKIQWFLGTRDSVAFGKVEKPTSLEGRLKRGTVVILGARHAKLRKQAAKSVSNKGLLFECGFSGTESEQRKVTKDSSMNFRKRADHQAGP
jgi:hypothetical protein